MRLVFMGTPEIARAALIALLRDGHEVAGVYTRADKPVGRHQTLEMPPVKKLALENGIPVLQPATLRTPGAAGQLAALGIANQSAQMILLAKMLVQLVGLPRLLRRSISV